VLNHARATVPFYREHALGNRLEDFPVISKDTVRNQFESFKSSAYFESFKSSAYKDKKNTPVLTSGSTGTPFKLFHDRNKRLRSSADIIYFAKQSGFEIGSRLIFMKVWNDINKKSTLKLWMENIKPY